MGRLRRLIALPGDADGAVEAHAWLEHASRVLIGRPVDERYVRLPSLESGRCAPRGSARSRSALPTAGLRRVSLPARGDASGLRAPESDASRRRGGEAAITSAPRATKPAERMTADS